jgi:hypothetical protein
MRRRSFRRAVALSVLLHVALAALLVVCLKQTPQPSPALDTRTEGEARLSMRFLDEPTVEMAVAPAPKPEAVPPPMEPKREVDAPATSGPPLAQTTPIPRTLPPELLAILKRPSPVGGEVVDVNITPTAMVDVNSPVAHAHGSPMPAPGSPQTQPIHGPLPDAKSIVYVLDASGSMGEWGKLAKARKALVATLRAQSPVARFQVVVYNGTARALLPTANGGCVRASAENVRLAEEKLAAVEPVGRSDHAAGLRMAMNFRPDFVLILTDADDLAAAKLRGVLTQAARPAIVCVGMVTADGVGVPREWK